MIVARSAQSGRSKVSAFLARGSVTATGSTSVLAVELFLCSASDSCGDGRRLGVSQAKKCEGAIKSRQQTGSQRAVGAVGD